MSSAAARRVALATLVEIEAGGWSDRLLQARATRLDDARDRAALHALVFAVLRWQGALDARLAPHARGGLAALDAPLRAALRLGLAEAALLGHPVALAVDAAVHAARGAQPRGAGLVNAVLRATVRAGVPTLDPRATLPAWLLARWERHHGAERAAAMLAAINSPARPCAVARPDRGGRDALAADLASDGVTTETATYHPWGLEVTHGVPQASGAFARGDILLLDEAAALVAALARPDDARPAADLTAAPGGKAALLAQGPAPVVALELVASRVGTLRATLARRAPEGRAVAVRGDALTPPLPAGRCGTVLLDAPCSGTGTLRRRPEKRWRLEPADITACAARQAALLERAAELVAPGGALVYAVCSVEPEEGEDLLRAFLARHPAFSAADPLAWVGPAAAGLVRGDPPRLSTAGAAGLEGFTAARLTRRA